MGEAQHAAVRHVRGIAARSGAAERIEALLGAGVPLVPLLTGIRRARVTVNFHPDRLLADGRSVVEALDADGRFRSQFETGISAGGLTAFAGGDRDRWEETLFGGTYQGRTVGRPCYGGLNLLAHPDGACPRFGSCHVRLRPAVLQRCTFSAGDSHLAPVDVGTLAEPAPVLAALLEAAAGRGVVLGAQLNLPGLLRLLRKGTPPPRPGVAPGRALDDYVEVQVHGGVDLARDVEGVVADPAFRGTPTGAALERLARRRGLPLQWHQGFALAASEVPEHLRGPAVVEFAHLVARRSAGRTTGPVLIDAALIGRAAAALPRDPQTLQLLKQLWHVLVAVGHAAPR